MASQLTKPTTRLAAGLVSTLLLTSAAALAIPAASSAQECLQGPIATRYEQLGGASGKLGRVTGCEQSTSAGVKFSSFEAGSIYWSSTSGAWDVSGSFHQLWSSSGWENGFLGMPTSGEVPIRAGGVFQNYQGGTLYWSPATGAHSVSGAFRDLYAHQGYEGSFLAYPMTQEVRVRGGVFQVYQGGVMYWSPTSGAHTVSGAFRDLYRDHGYENGPLGFPTSQEVPLRNNGVFQNYQGGTMYWSPASGAAAVRGAILGKYAQLGYEGGYLGYPTSSEFDIPGGKRTNFQHGYIEWSPARGAVANQPIAPCRVPPDGRHSPEYAAECLMQGWEQHNDDLMGAYANMGVHGQLLQMTPDHVYRTFEGCAPAQIVTSETLRLECTFYLDNPEWYHGLAIVFGMENYGGTWGTFAGDIDTIG
ncbi:hypothetical protein GTQ99_09270 [Kineococcus sp. T13]|uniref:LGFP repeat-containing protein n=1 Tax=Kineococcus vitellinus TaxID=2696565 RepID=UPI0014137332|nr:hypothetical protein [Kineococcus vitellinus]NAZ75607.1 hypothetical protein [Kineococcus vitellinus]